jgi:ABC-2 type transport system ATP-binding protein
MARVSRRTVVIAAAVVAMAGAAGGVAAASADDGYAVRTEQLWVTATPEPGTSAAPVRLDATLYLPQGAPQAPAVLLAHGFGGSKADTADQARRLARRGYVALAWTARGFGRSGGLIHLDAPDFEVADASRILDLLATRPEVLLDATGDPRVGVAGGSYGGGLALLLAGHDRRVDAIVPQITWNDLGRSLFPQSETAPGAPRSYAGLEPVATPGVFKKGWAGVFFSPQGQGEAAEAEGADAAAPEAAGAGAASTACGRFAADVCEGYRTAATTGRPTQPLLDLLAASSPATVLNRITAPTMLIQGEADSLFPLSEAEANARGIAAAGTPVKLVWFSGGHDGGTGSDAETARITAASDAWLDRYLRRDGSPADTRFEVTVPAAAVSSVNGRAAAQVRQAPVAPGVTGPGSPSTRAITLRGGQQTVQAPAGASPAALTSVPGLGAALAAAGSAGARLGQVAGQVAVFDSDPLTGTLHLVGGSRVTVRVTGTGTDATLFAQLLDVPAEGSAVLPQQLVAPVYLPSVTPQGRDVTIATPAVVRDVAAGHRLRLVISTTDQGYAMPSQPRAYRIGPPSGAAGVTLTAPDAALASVDVGGVRDLWPWAAALLLAALGTVGAGLLVGRRRRAAPHEPALAGVPLAVDGLGKAYGDGFRAVSELTFRVEAGWVLGLLGPNGAGKTTTLRMLMGLIRPTEGRITVFGHTVTAGAPVLSRVGSFVEGPGFLPHVSGLQNLTLYWQATGRPAADSHLDEALEIAGLGADVHRRVKTYSQGMRQRLAIAQAMLGLPDLLVLDEPTNGLDPPQIREMREVLARYAATGRTVVVSSHLLSEVEQTCTHVVVMHRGRLVAQGPVAELAGSATLLAVDVDDPARAAEIAAGVPGTQDVEVTPTGLSLTLVGTPRAELVKALVGAGIGVDRVNPQRGLEQAFLALVGESEG